MCSLTIECVLATALRRLRAVDLQAQLLREHLARQGHFPVPPLGGAGGNDGGGGGGGGGGREVMGLIGPVLEGGRIGTPREARGTMSIYHGGGRVSQVGLLCHVNRSLLPYK